VSIMGKTQYKERLEDRVYVIPVLMKAFRVLAALEEEPEGLRVDDVARRTKISKSTTYRILRTFVANDLLVHCGNGAYRLPSGQSRFKVRAGLDFPGQPHRGLDSQ
jgi:DNA-binding IclR family transcriptional regulator